MKEISSRNNCYFTHSIVVDLVSILINIFYNNNSNKYSDIYTEDYIKSIQKNYRFLGEITNSLPFNGYGMLEFLLLNKNFNNLEAYKSYVLSLKDEDFFYTFYGQYIDKEFLKLALQDDENLNKLYSEYGDISTNYLALKGLFSNKDLFLQEFFSCLDGLYTEEFISYYEETMIKIYDELPGLESSLLTIEPLELSQKIMGKTFRNRGPYEDFIFIPSCLINIKAIRFFGKDQILIYSLNHKDFTKKDIINILKTISDETRFEIIELLSKEAPMTGKDLASKLGLSTPTISHHIDKLKEAGFTNEERVKNSKYYSINYNSMDKFINNLSSRFKNDKH
ncbi:winged helix-turn-helix domain-containing protein [Proteiniborus sp. MB09-C3]|uniref:ArsR/SmtB family transcription factor n=1 Tax=Proteiniborus sp. MB09-C3 TaxID=3050072 RepID=UPI0025577B26|nr:winged helix-turn-helix domain-containing protein [Proteiniborus sp. MB09-C3]WIV12468.1 winged helix-turn-helix domain-containing protein [Proteiniborus sp. MB09-C3]